MNEHRKFLEDAAIKAADLRHRQVLQTAMSNYSTKVDARKLAQFDDWQAARDMASTVKDHVIDALPEYLVRFEEKALANGMKVHWAMDDAAARHIIQEIVTRRGAKKVVKGKSMTSEEIELNTFLQGHGVEVFESDLGELIVQLRGEKPYHILTPAMHLNKDDIAKLFHEKFGASLESTAEELTLAAREYLRHAYLSADIGITGANFILAEEGALAIVENEGNIRLATACPPVHVAIVGIEKVLPSIRQLGLFLPLLTTSGTGQQLNGYTSIIRGPRAEGEIDGPEEMHVILLDNGRSELIATPELRKALRCIRCGACLNACPVYKTIGGHTYNAAYPGPIGSVITPRYEGMQRYEHLAQASSLCGACTEVCPVKIPLHQLIHRNRVAADEVKANDVSWRMYLRAWAQGQKTRPRARFARKLYQLFEPLTSLILSEKTRKRIPPLAKKTFAELWRERERPRDNS